MNIAKNIRKKRKLFKYSQAELAKRSAVSLGSIKRFESTGEISLFSLTKIAFVLDCEDELMKLFSRKEYKSIQEVIDEQD